jgi:uncharacterized membrane protein YjgN (DUF898 family)
MEPSSSENKNKSFLVIIAVILVVLIAGIIAGVVVLAGSDAETTARVRDIFIIILALESLLIGAALIILVIQLAVLTNLLQNEVRPILESTKETVGTLRSTSQFISKRAVSPIISVSSYFAGFRKIFEIIGFIRKK